MHLFFILWMFFVWLNTMNCNILQVDWSSGNERVWMLGFSTVQWHTINFLFVRVRAFFTNSVWRWTL